MAGSDEHGVHRSNYILLKGQSCCQINGSKADSAEKKYPCNFTHIYPYWSSAGGPPLTEYSENQSARQCGGTDHWDQPFKAHRRAKKYREWICWWNRKKKIIKTIMQQSRPDIVMAWTRCGTGKGTENLRDSGHISKKDITRLGGGFNVHMGERNKKLI